MKDWRALPSKGGLIGILLTVLAAVLFGLAVWLTWLAATATEVQAFQVEDAPADTPPDLVTVHTGTNLGTFGLGLLSFGLFLLVLYLAYQTRRFFALRYALDRNAITVALGDRKQVIPLANIRYVVPAETVLGQMRQRVFGQDEPVAEVATGPQNRAYPRSQPQPTVPYPEAADLGQLEPTESEIEVAQDEIEPAESYRLTQTAAADSSLEHLEHIEIIQADFVEIEGDDLAVDAAEIEEGQITEIEDFKLEQVRGLAASFEEQADQEQPASQAPADSGHATPDPFESGSVNFTVKTSPFTSWPGFYLNRSQVSSLGQVQFYSTQPLSKNLLIRTAQQTYAISPRDQQQFLTEYNLRRRLGAMEAVEEGVIKGEFLSHPLWQDWLGRGLILAGVVLNLLLYVFLIWRFNDLTPILRIHFNKLGQVDRIGDRGELMLLPFIGLLAVVGNSLLGALLHPKERIVAYLLYGSAILLQLLTAIAVIVIMAVS